MGCLGSSVIAFLGILTIFIGAAKHESVTPISALPWTALALGILGLCGYMLLKKDPRKLETVKKRRGEINALTSKYNKMVKAARNSSEYNTISSIYNSERSSLINSWDDADAVAGTSFSSFTSIWKTLGATGFILTTLAGCFGIGVVKGPALTAPTPLMEKRSWNADNIPMPHMEDHSLYVSNPDSILSPSVESQINETLGQLDDNLGIESAMVIVGHIDNDEPIDMVRGIYDKYKVGRNDRGLVIVVGYLDHSYFIAPGRSLEGDLTDAECAQLARSYLIPSMKAEQPDSGMLYLAKGVLALMSEKEMPVMSSLTSPSSDDSGDSSSLLLYPALLVIWGIFYLFLRSKTNPMFGTASLKGNPFYVRSSSTSDESSSSTSDESSSSDGYDGGDRSGGYGGGSWGGGGAGGRW